MLYRSIAVSVMLILSIISTNNASACGTCGCNMSNYNPELLMRSGYHSVGLFTQARWYSGSLHNHGNSDATDEYNNYSELRSLYELRGTWYPIAKLSVTASLPFSYNHLALESDKLEQHIGLGDAMLILQYQILREGKLLAAKGYEQRLLAGAGVKFPTGRFNKVGYDGELNPQLQNGSGSFDFLFIAGYFIKLRKFALSTDMNYKLNTTNKNGYKFANGFNANFKGMYIHNWKKVSLAPSIGGRFETSSYSTQNGELDNLITGGDVCFITVGTELYYKNFSVGITYLQPVYQGLLGEQFETNAGFQAGLKYSFNNNIFKKKTSKD